MTSVHDVDWCSCPDCERRMRIDKEAMMCMPGDHSVVRDWHCYHCKGDFVQTRIYKLGIVQSDIITKRRN